MPIQKTKAAYNGPGKPTKRFKVNWGAGKVVPNKQNGQQKAKRPEAFAPVGETSSGKGAAAFTPVGETSSGKGAAAFTPVGETSSGKGAEAFTPVGETPSGSTTGKAKYDGPKNPDKSFRVDWDGGKIVPNDKASVSKEAAQAKDFEPVSQRVNNIAAGLAK
jgi:hypothetical protein